MAEWAATAIAGVGLLGAAAAWIWRLRGALAAVEAKAAAPAPTPPTVSVQGVAEMGAQVGALDHKLEMLAAQEDWRWRTIEKTLTSHAEATKDLTAAIREMATRK